MDTGLRLTITPSEGREHQWRSGYRLLEIAFKPYACASGKCAKGRRGRALRAVLSNSPLRTDYTVLDWDWEPHGECAFAVTCAIEVPDDSEPLETTRESLAAHESVDAVRTLR